MTCKRLIDIVVSAAGLILLAPLLGLLALAVIWSMGFPVFFRQQRPGLHGRLFKIIKFRTMAKLHDAHGALLPDEKRMTRVGTLLRQTSLDELPELWNVLRGEMSLVGPRPLLTAYLDRYTTEQARRHEVRPGITGWAQVNGRNAISWDEKFALDIWYVDNRNLWLDVKILLLTLIKVVRHEGIQAANHATMPEFMGNSTSDSRR